MTFAALDAGLVYLFITTDIVMIEVCGKPLTLYNIMAAVTVEMVCRPIVKGLIYAPNAISLLRQVELSTSRGTVRRRTLLNAISGNARA